MIVKNICEARELFDREWPNQIILIQDITLNNDIGPSQPLYLVLACILNMHSNIKKN